MTELEGYEILSKPYIRTKEMAKVLGISNNYTSKLMKEKEVRRIHKGVYITADFVKKFGLSEYWKQVQKKASSAVDAGL